MKVINPKTIITSIIISCAASFLIIAPYRKVPRENPYIVTTTTILAEIVGNITGDKITVESIMPRYTNPHDALVPTKIIYMLEESDLVIKNGLHLEGALDHNLQVNEYQKGPKICEASSALDSGDIIKQGGIWEDPHFWMDPQLIIKFVDFIVEKIVEIDGKNEDFYREKAKKYKEKLQKRVDKMKELGKRLQEKAVILTHNSLSYLEKYGITVKPIRDISLSSQPTTQRMQSLVDYIIENKINVIFKEMATNDKAINALIEKSKRRGHTVNEQILYTDVLPREKKYRSYIGMLDKNIESLEQLV